MPETRRLILSSRVGTFYFYPDARMSHAKLVRDAVMGQILNPDPEYRMIKVPADAYLFVKTLRGSIKETPFVLSMREKLVV